MRDRCCNFSPNQKEPINLSERGINPEYLNLRNVAGEIFGVLIAINGHGKMDFLR
ncbi:MAG: hypothetical protein LBF68_01890 [Christensenellaceae bacterium]|jgi:hypothetical protein|nr:hypothetical protein [Christensenellaceae bacterium]